MKAKSIGFIGGGRITRILLKGFQNKNLKFPSIVVCDTEKETLLELESMFPGIRTTHNIMEIAKQDLIFIALHPPVIAETISKIKDALKVNALILSLAPKFSIENLSSLINTTRIVRMIPNATSYINKGVNPVCFSSDIDASEKKSILENLNVFGKTFETEESKLEAYAIVSAMLPTYFWFQWMEMEKIGQKIGLSRNESKETVHDTLVASLALMYESGLAPEEVLDLIPVKPIAEKEPFIKEIFNDKLISLFEKIKPERSNSHLVT